MKTKIIFFGTPMIAVPSLQALIDNDFDVLSVVTQPDKPKGRGNLVQAPPVKELAMKYNIPVLQPAKIRNNAEFKDALISLAPDFIAVVAYGKILPSDILSIPRLAPVNLHFSLLPLYRGAAPVNWAILNGDAVTGADTMIMGVNMDDGDILLSMETPINRKNAVELAEELSESGATLLVKTLKEFKELTPIKQDSAKATLAPMMTKELGAIDWSQDASYIERMTRAFAPWPVAYTYFNGKILKIFQADVDENPDKGVAASCIYNVTKTTFSVKTGNGGLVIKELQIEGKRRMSVSDFLSGVKLSAGIKLGQ